MKYSFFIFLFLLVACTSIDCPLQNVVRSYYAIQNAEQKTDTLKDTLNIVSHRFDGSDTLLLNNCANVTLFSLPVGYSNPEDTLFFHFKNMDFSAVDTVWIKKENMPHFESVDCSAAFFHRITAVRMTHHAIDSININNPLVDYDPQKVHFHLYIKSRN